MHAPPRASTTAQVHAQPPYLASQTAGRNARPIDPYRGSLQLTMILFGVALIIAFNTPTHIEPKPHFLFEDLSKVAGKLKVLYILLPATGLLGLLLGAIPLPSIGRGATAAILGIFGILYPALALPADFEWRGLVAVVATLTLPAGLLLRGAYRDAMLGRILTTVGVVCVLVLYFVPEHDALPIKGFIEKITDGKNAEDLVGGIFQLLPLALALVSLLAWLPGPSTAGAPAFAWLWITLPIATHFAHLIVKGHIADVVKLSPYGALFGRVGQDGVVVAAFTAFAGYGLATLLGKNLEHR
jgi:hypothetical protein